MLTELFQVPPESLAEFCRRNHIRKLALFGSWSRGEARPDSDVDLLVEFDPGHRIGYFGMASLELELGRILGGRKVDLRTPAELSRYFRDEVVNSSVVEYAAL